MAPTKLVTYIGDGVTAEWDGFQIRLSTTRVRPDDEDGSPRMTVHEIFLDLPTYIMLKEFAEKPTVFGVSK